MEVCEGCEYRRELGLKDTWQKCRVMLTRKCNIRCPECAVIRYREPYRLSLEQWFRVFDILKKYRVGFVVLYGGEPLLCPELPEIVRYLNSIKLSHTIVTNATLAVKNPDKYLKPILKAEPYGFTTSVNMIRDFRRDIDSELKSEVGFQLIQQLKKEYGDAMDLCVNGVVSRVNIEQIPEYIQFFTEKEIWSIFVLLHLARKEDGMYWWYRAIENEETAKWRFKPSDKERLQRFAEWIEDNYNNLLLHNSIEYFKAWSLDEAIHQCWKCKYWTYPNINPDGTLMQCVDRPLSRPINILELEDEEKEKEVLRSMRETIASCPGCFWDDWECNYYVDKGMVEWARLHFAHKA